MRRVCVREDVNGFRRERVSATVYAGLLTQLLCSSESLGDALSLDESVTESQSLTSRE